MNHKPIVQNFLGDNSVFRFAPSPTGFIHLGNIRTAIFNYLMAKSCNGKFLLRIEDTDKNRFKQEYLDDIFNKFKWLNIEYNQLIYQSEQVNNHVKILDILREKKVLYYCNCDKQDKCLCKNKDFGTGALRFKVPNETILCFNDFIRGDIRVNCNTIEDFVLARADGSVTYNLGVVVDDYNSKVTHVVRGADHLYNTYKQILLYNALGWDIPKFAHLPLILDNNGSKLSKRNQDISLKYFESMGFLPETIFNYLLRLGWSFGNVEIFTKAQILKDFKFGKLQKSSGKFAVDKLLFQNRIFLNQLNDEQIITYVNKKDIQLFKFFSKEYCTINEIKNLISNIYKNNVNNTYCFDININDFNNWNSLYEYILQQKNRTILLKQLCVILLNQDKINNLKGLLEIIPFQIIKDKLLK